MASTALKGNTDEATASYMTTQVSDEFPRQFTTCANEIKDYGIYEPQTVGNWGSTSNWTLSHNIAQYFGRILLEFNTTALITPATPMPANSFRYDDFLGYAAIDQAKLRYGSSDVESLDGEFIKFKYYDEQMPNSKRVAITELVRGPLSAGQRRIDLQRGTRCLVEIPFYFTRGYRGAMPLVNAQDINISILWRAFSMVVDCDDGESLVSVPAPSTITGQRLIVQHVYVPSSEATSAYAMSQATGVWKLVDRQQLQVHIEAGGASNVARTININPTSFSLPLAYLQCVVRFFSQFATPYQIRRWQLHGGPLDPDCRLTLDPYLSSSSGNVKSPVPPGVIQPYNASYGGRSDLLAIASPFWLIDFCNTPLNPHDASGSQLMAGIANPQFVFTVTFPSGVARQLQINLFGTTKSQTVQQNGELKIVYT